MISLTLLMLIPLAFANRPPKVPLWMCPEINRRVTCGDETPMKCPGGYDENYCPKEDFCVPAMTGIIGNDGNECYAVCVPQCNENEVYCDYGTDRNGCPWGGICKEQWGRCPRLCSTFCHNEPVNKTACYPGFDADGCYIQPYCAEECPETT